MERDLLTVHFLKEIFSLRVINIFKNGSAEEGGSFKWRFYLNEEKGIPP